MHGELDRELRGGGDVFVAVQGARPGVHVRASQLYIVRQQAPPGAGDLPETAGRSLEKMEDPRSTP